MRRDISKDAARMRKRAQQQKDAEYIREGEYGWQRRRNHIERRTAARLRSAEAARQRIEDDRRLILAAEAAFDAKERRGGHDSETDSPGREESLIGNAVEEGLNRRREAQQARKDQLSRSAKAYEAVKNLPRKTLPPIHPSVLEADYNDLMAAGWGDYERWRIPEDWQTHPPASEIPPVSEPTARRNPLNRPN